MSDGFIEAHASAKPVLDHRLRNGTLFEEQLALAYRPVGLSLVEDCTRDRTRGDHAGESCGGGPSPRRLRVREARSCFLFHTPPEEDRYGGQEALACSNNAG
jgi:hypothetical protein